jgi:hypothetical protein
MPHQNLNARKALVHQSNITVNSGASFGFHRVSGYQRITGLAYAVGSMAIRFQSQLDSAGPVLVSSVWVANSGPNFLNVPNRSTYVTIDVTAATSGGQAGSLLVTGEPLS